MTTVEKDRTTRTEAAAIMPFGGWESTPTGTASADDEVLFRFPAPDDPAPSTARLLTLALWAAGLGFSALGAGALAMADVLGGAAFWYVPTLAFFGLLSVVMAAASFLSIHRPVLPWLLLTCATGPLAVDILIAVLY
ncbi:hypothetical protein JIG36_25210 [Actinoplanes sp. LDG1-06]|uniref:Uncharacterized protein n=1 Tax=Paractinoplanes ovalisporus TaxID=2810368 RepID=A0ABS2AGC8_9ACTN|nr:hypothetical protein [Actinoplanes ovalisporus]MBM2618862.1 hypothetical protein [Actinoplanes ovalisporus]